MTISERIRAVHILQRFVMMSRTLLPKFTELMAKENRSRDEELKVQRIRDVYDSFEAKSEVSELEDLYVACVIDLNLNASLTYHPNHLVCNKKGETKAIIFTNAKEIFLVETSAFKKVELVDGPIALEMENITAQIKRPTDLKSVLAI
ncbi:MAG: hypothetical protein ACPG21_00410 [Crocinitomicaceae bacterium]